MSQQARTPIEIDRSTSPASVILSVAPPVNAFGRMMNPQKASSPCCTRQMFNDKYEAVTRLLGLPRLPKHSKTGVGMYLFVSIHRHYTRVPNGWISIQ
jgi:hypothetical protein